MTASKSVVLALLVVVHALGATNAIPAEGNRAKKAGEAKSGGPAKATQPAAVPTAPSEIPASVRDMVDAIQTAARSGRIEEMKTALDWNELKPDLASTPVKDPLAYWKSISADGEGRQILAILLTLLETQPAVMRTGKDLENNRVFVWPGLAEKPLATLTPAEDVELYRLLPPADAKAMKATGRYKFWRLAIGADGTWHSFRQVD